MLYPLNEAETEMREPEGFADFHLVISFARIWPAQIGYSTDSSIEVPPKLQDRLMVDFVLEVVAIRAKIDAFWVVSMFGKLNEVEKELLL